MKLRGYYHVAIIISASIATIALYIWFISTSLFGIFQEWSQQHLPLFISTLLLIKIAGIVWPPIPGGVLTLGSIPILGWMGAYLVDFVGSIIGSSIAYCIARRCGIQFMQKIFDVSTIEKIRHVRIMPRRELEAIFLFRTFGGTIVELVCYAAGLLRIRYSKFLMGTILSHLLVGIPIYYFAESLIRGKGLALNALALLLLVILFFIARKRYIIRE